MDEQRIRSQNSSLGTRTSNYSSYTWTNDGTNQFVSQVDGQFTTDLGDESLYMEDVVTENFYSRQKRGEVINNPLISSKVKETLPEPGNWGYNTIDFQNGLKYGWSAEGSRAVAKNDLQPYLETSSGFLDEIETATSQAVTQAHANASSSEVSLLMVSAEAHKTVASMTSITYRVLKIVKAARKLDLKYLRKQISRQELEDRYMELRYALRPLLYDAEGCIAAVEKSKHYGKTRVTSRGYSKLQHSDEDQLTFEMGAATWTVTRKISHMVDIRAGVLSDVMVSSTSNWGLDQVAETLWEVIPFSFIVDWFFNVGQTIAAWAPSAGVTELASWVVVRSTTIQTNRLSDIHITNPYRDLHNIWWEDQEKKYEVHETNRIVNPQLNVYPTTKVRLDTFKLLDLAIIGKRAVGRLT